MCKISLRSIGTFLKKYDGLSVALMLAKRTRASNAMYELRPELADALLMNVVPGITELFKRKILI